MNKLSLDQTEFQGIKTLFHYLKSKDINAKETLFVVGGCVRDTLLGIPANDVDILFCAHNSNINHNVMEKLGFELQKKDNFIQVYGSPSGMEVNFDERPEALMLNLKERDFTINSMAVPLETFLEFQEELSNHVDVIKNYTTDVLEHRLVANSESCIENDPIRVIRGLRFATKYNLAVSSTTKKYFRKYWKEEINKNPMYVPRVKLEIQKAIDSFDSPKKVQQFFNMLMDYQIFHGFCKPSLPFTDMDIPLFEDKKNNIYQYGIQLLTYFDFQKDVWNADVVTNNPFITNLEMNRLFYIANLLDSILSNSDNFTSERVKEVLLLSNVLKYNPQESHQSTFLQAVFMARLMGKLSKSPLRYKKHIQLLIDVAYSYWNNSAFHQELIDMFKSSNKSASAKMKKHDVQVKQIDELMIKLSN